MALLSDDIRDLLRIMTEHGVEFAICGGHAVAYHGYPRMTMDVETASRPSERSGRS